MEDGHAKIILFPHWQKRMEEKAFALIKQKQFREALKLLNQLLEHGVDSYQINSRKLICLMELKTFEEAEGFCRQLLDQSDEHYYYYLHYYLIILFQTNQFDELILLIESEEKKGNIPSEFKDYFRDLYQLSLETQQDMRMTESKEYITQLETAFKEQDYRKQWLLINQLRKINANPLNHINRLLKDKKIHPVVKTTLFNWLQENEVTNFIEVEKLGSTALFKPSEVEDMSKHPVLKQTFEQLIIIEQQNPTLYKMLEDLLIRYVYVRYPFIYPVKDIPFVSQAVIIIGKENLNLVQNEETSEKVEYYIEEIKLCNILFLNVIDE